MYKLDFHYQPLQLMNYEFEQLIYNYVNNFTTKLRWVSTYNMNLIEPTV